ncbi:MAG: hypothetical protein LBF68_05895, partial [Christensenellaceae bacterium]|nr:hypothetical protein [Christensenellaceae bacterium]
DIFNEFIPLAPNKVHNNQNSKNSVFNFYTHAVITCRDKWAYSYSYDTLSDNINICIDNYIKQKSRRAHDVDNRKFSCTRSLLVKLKKNIDIKYNSDSIVEAMYRPFVKKLLYYSNDFVEVLGQSQLLFPKKPTDNLVISISGTGVKNKFNVLMARNIVDFQCLDNTRCFPLYIYDVNKNKQIKNNQTAVFDDGIHENTRKDGISDYFANLVELKYKKRFEKTDIFYYIYGLLHSKAYQSIFSDDLRLQFPRIPLVKSIEDFIAFSDAGRHLASLHLNYEDIMPLNELKVTIDKEIYNVTKMHYRDTKKRDVIVYNEYITIENIPLATHDYIFRGKSVLNHIIDQYQIKIDKESGIILDPNEWCKYVDNPKYILNLVLSVITVSVKTMEIINSLPPITVDKDVDLR